MVEETGVRTYLSVPAWFLLDLQLCLDPVGVEVSSSLVSPVSAGLPEVGARVREHGLRLRLRRLQLDARRRDRLRDAASLHVSRLIWKRKLKLLKSQTCNLAMINQVWDLFYFSIINKYIYLRAEIAKDDDLGLFVTGLLSKSLVSENIIRHQTIRRKGEGGNTGPWSQ